MSGEFKKAMDERRIATFSVDRRLLWEEPDTVKAILDKCLIVESRHIFDPPGVDYTAYSPAFDPLAEGVRPPRVRIFERRGPGRFVLLEFGQ